MADLSEMDAVAMARRRRLQREALGTDDRPPLGPSDEPTLRDVAVWMLWLIGVALIVASLFL